MALSQTEERRVLGALGQLGMGTTAEVAARAGISEKRTGKILGAAPTVYKTGEAGSRKWRFNDHGPVASDGAA